MSTQYATLSTMKTGKDNYKMKVRVIRKWRGATKKGEEFKSFNIMLLDHKDTKIQEIPQGGTNIATEFFDFYDLSELLPLVNETKYVIDVVGVMKDHNIPLEQITNRHGEQQEQAKFVISDGKTNVNVTFWDKYAQKFVEALSSKLDTPVIIIIAACRVQLWNNEPNITHVAPTAYYLNFKHHSVNQLRRMLAVPDFSQKVMAVQKKKISPLLTVEGIKGLGKDSIEVCTSCDLEVEITEGLYSCKSCRRIVPHPEIRFRLVVIAADSTGSIEVILRDREVRTVIAKRAREIIPRQAPEGFFPDCFKLMAKKPYTIKIEITEANVVNKSGLYWGTNICQGFKLESAQAEVQQTLQTEKTQATSSTQMPALSGLHYDSSTLTN
ncbi:hypothetical protein DCAR_0625279 [Daucus carota subsp. sativus]|uniref:Uncharacterized protein n=1 Tax=Daucus carota subsp. sativus TaxID=79200 RepID=A0A161XFD7_DAUCS|nr:hypothetical protein DCAR_0625279 [Daucus carota subsp. sativus]